MSERKELREALENLIAIVDVYVPDEGILKGKLVMAISYESTKQHCWTPQNSIEHACIDMLGGAIRGARDAIAFADANEESGG